MDQCECMRIKSKYFHTDIQDKYNIDNHITNDGYVCYIIKKGMYRLAKSASLSSDTLLQYLKKYGYKPDIICPNIWEHETRIQNSVYMLMILV